MKVPSRRAAALVPALAVCAALAGACSKAEPGDQGGANGAGKGAAAPESATPPPGERLLVVDGVTVTFGDLAQGLELFDRLDPNASRRGKIARILEEYVLPLEFARREFAAERAEQLEKAKALCAVAGNAVELQQAARLAGSEKAVSARQVEIPIAAFLFDPALTGAVSPPIELPQGYVVAAALDLQQSLVVAHDRCVAFQVGFTTHDAQGYAAWLRDLRRRLADKATWVHPDYRLAMPQWLRLPDR